MDQSEPFNHIRIKGQEFAAESESCREHGCRGSMLLHSLGLTMTRDMTSPYKKYNNLHP